MAVPVDFLRGVLGVLCIFFAHMAGRSVVVVRRGGKVSRLYAWLIRTLLCAVILIFRRRIDAIAISVWALAAVAFGVGLWSASRQRREEDLTHQMFPE